MKNDKVNDVFSDIGIQLSQIDFSHLLHIAAPMIVYYVSKKAIGAYQIHREYKPKKISQVLLPPELEIKEDKIDYDKIMAGKFKDSIVLFSRLLINHFPKKDLGNFYNNINELKMKTKKRVFPSLSFDFSTGKYEAVTNEITVYEDAQKLTMYHELFHMASSAYKNGKRYAGFHQASVQNHHLVGIGKGLNEGYTELLTHRYFELMNINNAGYSYEYFTRIALCIENLIGRKKMESMYLRADLAGLIKELKQYASEEEIMRFINDVDFLVKYLYDKRLRINQKSNIEKCFKSISKFLIKCQTKESLKELGSKTGEEIFGELINYVSYLALELRVGKNSYETLGAEDIIEIGNDLAKKCGLDINFNSLYNENNDESKKM